MCFRVLWATELNIYHLDSQVAAFSVTVAGFGGKAQGNTAATGDPGSMEILGRLRGISRSPREFASGIGAMAFAAKGARAIRASLLERFFARYEFHCKYQAGISVVGGTGEGGVGVVEGKSVFLLLPFLFLFGGVSQFLSSVLYCRHFLGLGRFGGNGFFFGTQEVHFWVQRGVQGLGESGLKGGAGVWV